MSEKIKIVFVLISMSNPELKKRNVKTLVINAWISRSMYIEFVLIYAECDNNQAGTISKEQIVELK